MIVDAIVLFFVSLSSWFLDLLPTISIFGNNEVAPQSLVNVLSGVACIVPVGTLVVALGIWLVLANFAWLYGVVRWVYSKIPGVN